MTTYQWLLGIHVLAAVLFVGGAVAVGALHSAAMLRDRPTKSANCASSFIFNWSYSPMAPSCSRGEAAFAAGFAETTPEILVSHQLSAGQEGPAKQGAGCRVNLHSKQR